MLIVNRDGHDTSTVGDAKLSPNLCSSGVCDLQVAVLGECSSTWTQ